MTNLFINIDFGSNPSVDDGTRPYPGTNPLWNNESIFMVGGPSQTQTSVGTATTVRVRVSNSGQSPVQDVGVDVYVMNPFVGAFDPNSAVVRMHGFAAQIATGSGGPAATDAHVVPCLVQDPNQGAIPWTPTQAQLNNSTNGHLCLVANAYADNDGGPLPDTQLFNVGSDPHQGQRNIALLATQQGQGMKLQVMPGPDGEQTVLDLHPLPAAVALQGGEHWLLRSRANISAVDGPGVGLAIAARDGRPAIPLTLSRKGVQGRLEIAGLGGADLAEMARGTQARDGAFARAGAAGWGGGRLALPATTTAAVATLAVDRSDGAGSLQVFDIVQRDTRGQVLGGLRVLSMQR